MRWTILTPLGAALFTIAWAVLGLVSPGYRMFDIVVAPYSPASQPISGLGLGVTGPWMNTAFIVSGLLILGGSVAATTTVWRNASRPVRVGFVLLCAQGVGMIIDGVFTLESVLLHLTGFVLAVLVPAAGLLLIGVAFRRRGQRSGTLITLAGMLAVVLFIAFQVTFDPYAAGDNVGIAGLLQRVLVTVVLTSVAIVVATTVPHIPRRTRPARLVAEVA